MLKIRPPLAALLLVSAVLFSFPGAEGEAALWDTPVRFANPIKGVHTARQPISGAAWIETGDGVVVIDTLTIPSFAADMMKKIKERGGTVKYIMAHPTF